MDFYPPSEPALSAYFASTISEVIHPDAFHQAGFCRPIRFEVLLDYLHGQNDLVCIIPADEMNAAYESQANDIRRRFIGYLLTSAWLSILPGQFILSENRNPGLV